MVILFIFIVIILLYQGVMKGTIVIEEVQAEAEVEALYEIVAMTKAEVKVEAEVLHVINVPLV
jgi:hypothetical protein